jgi:hypothetical protein
MNKTSMNYWWDKVRHLDVPMPRTEIPVTKDVSDWWSLLDGDDPLTEAEKHAIQDAAINVGGYPVFMRSDLCSGKHSFEKTCFVKNEDALIQQIWALVDDNCCNDLAMESIVVREYVPPAALFKAFRGLPIAPERRYFVRDGEVVCHHPYWPEDAIRHPDADDWRRLISVVNGRQQTDEVDVLTGYAERIARALGGDWSIDFMLGLDGIWWFIDVATAMQSWHPPCPKCDCGV